MTTITEFAAGFREEPGYLDFARVGPPSAAVLAEVQGQMQLLFSARFGSLGELDRQDLRLRIAIAAGIGFDAEQVVFQPNTSSGLMHAMFGLTGGVMLSPDEAPSVTFAAVRAAEAMHVLTPIWLQTDHGRVTPGQIRDQITSTTTAVAVSLVDPSTGYLADIEGIRQVIGDRLLIVDAIQGFGVVDAPYQVADVVVCGGQTWLRSGWGTGFMALSARAAEEIVPVFSGFCATDEDEPMQVVPPARGAATFSVANPDFVAEARFATAVEEVNAIGVPAIQAEIDERVSRLIDIADEFGIRIVSSRDRSERAGIVVVEPPAGQQTRLAASLFNHGITATSRGETIRFSVHVSTGDDGLEMLRAAFTSFATTAVF